jgi:signal transduction histidine kinase/streptogramin lyase
VVLAGDFWFSTFVGLNQYSQNFVTLTMEDGLVNNDLRSILQDSQGRFWFSTLGGVSCYDGETFTNFTSANGLLHDQVYRLLEDVDGYIWMGTERGASCYDGETFTNYTTRDGLPHDRVYTLFQDSSDILWFGTTEGVSRYDGETFTNYTTRDGLPHNDINNIFEDRQGRLWFATEGGTCYYDGETFTSYTSADGLVNDNVHGLAQDGQDRLWFSTLGGVSCYDGQTFTNYTQEDGLASDQVFRVFEDSLGYMWFATWAGINRYDGEVFQTLNRHDGLAGGSFLAFLEDRQGRLWLGSGSGITCYFPAAPSPPPIVIRAVVADRRYEELTDIRIPASSGLTAFEFYGINFKTRPGAMVYRYRLRGCDETWHTTHERRVEYQDLPPCAYAFQVIAVDRDMNYSMPAEVAIEVVADARDEMIDELETRVSERTRELQEKNSELEETLVQLQETQNQLVVQEKLAALGNLVAGIAHELNSPLGAVKSTADVLTRGIGKIRETLDQGTELAEIKTNRSFDQVVQLLDNSIGATTTAIDRISQIVDSLKNFTRLDQADYQLADVHEGIESTLTLLEHQFKGRIEVSRHYGELPSIYCYPGELNQVFMNVLMNAVQAIVDAGSIRVKTYADAADVYVEVADSGRGIPKDRLQHIFEPNFAQKDARVGLSLGLATSYNIVRKHQGFLRLESEIDKGTIVTIVLPIKSN